MIVSNCHAGPDPASFLIFEKESTQGISDIIIIFRLSAKTPVPTPKNVDIAFE